MIPGNLLNIALKVTGSQAVNYLEYLGQTETTIGTLVDTFKPAVCVRGSFQGVPRSRYEVQGLDFQKNYSTFFASRDINDIVRSIGTDRFVFAGKTFQTLSETDWRDVNGWTGVLCVELKNAG